MMNFTYQLRESLVSLTTNPLRSGLSIIGVVFGVASVVAMLSIGLGAEKEVESLLNALGAQNVHVTANELDEDGWNRVLKATTGLGDRDLRLARDLLPEADIAEVSAWKTSDANKPLPGTRLTLFGVTENFHRVLGGDFVAGRSFTARENELARPVAVIGLGLARKWFGDDPHKALGASFRADRSWLTVIGVISQGEAPVAAEAEAGEAAPEMAEKPEMGGKDAGGPKVKLLRLDDAVLLPLASAQRRLGPLGPLAPLERLVIKLDPAADPIATRKALESRLRVLHRGADVLTVTAADEVIEQKRSTTRLFSYFLLAIALISLVVGGIGIANVMLASMVERIREVGLRRAIGAKKRHILFQFLTEALTICLIGGVMGGLAGMGVAAAAAWFTGWNAVFPWWSIVVAVAISTVVGTLAGLYPAVTASRISPIEALQGRA